VSVLLGDTAAEIFSRVRRRRGCFYITRMLPPRRREFPAFVASDFSSLPPVIIPDEVIRADVAIVKK
jgi:hypothetical protein